MPPFSLAFDQISSMPFLLSTTSWPSSFVTLRTSTNTATPSFFSTISGTLAVMDAVPPMWNVRIVSCVPGSPMDCAAMMPTAVPISTCLPVERSRP